MLQSKYLKISIALLVFLKPLYGQNTSKLLDSVIVKGQIDIPSSSYRKQEIFISNQESKKLSDVLQEQGVYLKNYGNGQLSSISLRGTSASHTQTYWNGFSINSPSLGQMDYSLLPVFFLDKSHVNFGHSSMLDGVGGIGGGISLKNQTKWSEGLKIGVLKEYGSFNSFTSGLSISFSSKKVSISSKAWETGSANNFSYADLSKKEMPLVNQQNSAYYQYGFQQEVAVKLSSKNELESVLQYINSERQLPAIIGAVPSKQRQWDESVKSYLSLKHLFKHAFIRYKIGVFNDHLVYEDPIAKIYAPFHSFSIQQRLEYMHYLKNNASLALNTIGNNVEVKGEGIGGSKNRTEYSIGGKWEQEVQSFRYDVMGRFALVDTGFLPLIYGLGIGYEAIKGVNVRLAYSKNYRLPTLNDLYWSVGGNTDLKPENSSSAEAGVTLARGKWKLEGGIFSGKIENWIQWTPNTTGIWSPKNFKNVKNQGVESSLRYAYTNKKNLSGFFNVNYTYASSTNQASEFTSESILDKQLIYTPKHTLGCSVEVTCRVYTLRYAQNLTSRAYLDETNSMYLPYTAPASIQIRKAFSYDNLGGNIQFTIQNVYNEAYQLVANRPLPGRNFQVALVLNIK